MNDNTDKTVIKLRKNGNDNNNKSKSLKLLLTIIEGNEVDFGKTFHFEKKKIKIGRKPSNDVVVNDLMISKFHCEIYISKDKDNNYKVELNDLNSTNGTYVNGELIDKKELISGDKIEIGKTILRVFFDDEYEENFHSKLFQIAVMDSLTGLFNKRYIFNEIENQIKISKRNKRYFSIIILDIDDFKKINDNFGHLAGDRYLKLISEKILSSLREQDIAGRFGGEEFIIILPETKEKGAFSVAERIRTSVEKAALKYKDYILKTTISGGVAEYGKHAKTRVKLLEIADKALYKAKKTGKNKIDLPDVK